jgi:hypothetical protein
MIWRGMKASVISKLNFYAAGGSIDIRGKRCNERLWLERAGSWNGEVKVDGEID